MADSHAGMVDPSLLEVVPWTYGFAHSWALGALIVDPRTAATVLGCFGLPEAELASDVQRERWLNPARADLAFSVRDKRNRIHQIAVETKVNDPFHASQVQAYRDQGYLPALFLPGLTGVLLDPTPPTAAGEVRITGGDLLAALDTVDVGFGPLLKGYLDVLRAEGDRIEHALRAAREGTPVDVGEGESPAHDLVNVAWLAEVYRALPAGGRAVHSEPWVGAGDEGLATVPRCGSQVSRLASGVGRR
jgi:hypothetical protein